MEYMNDIRRYKTALRQKYRAFRSKLSPVEKSKLDKAVLERALVLNQYAVADTVLTYVSKDEEIDTKHLIEKALCDGKKVAVPCCIPGTRQMNFYYIKSLDELSVKSFGVLEPEMDDENIFTSSPHSICFVPALCFDRGGYRLGYGKGYYDRFLIGYDGVTVGLCYVETLRGHLQHGRFDRPVDLIVTEKFIKRTVSDRRTNYGGK